MCKKPDWCSLNKKVPVERFLHCIYSENPAKERSSSFAYLPTQNPSIYLTHSFSEGFLDNAISKHPIDAIYQALW